LKLLKGIWPGRKKFGNNEKKMPAEKFEMWKKKATANKPKPKPIKIDDFDEDLDGKYYIKTNWINQLKTLFFRVFFFSITTLV
jgi:hypothetical protein